MANTTLIGPGSLIVGETGTTLEISCQVTQAVVSWDVDAEDDTPLLCGEVEAGDETFTATLSATLFQDLGVDAAESIVAYSWANRGAVVPIVFIPSTAAGKQVTGSVKLRPVDVGGEAKTKATSDVEWPFVGEPELSDVPEGGAGLMADVDVEDDVA